MWTDACTVVEGPDDAACFSCRPSALCVLIAHRIHGGPTPGPTPGRPTRWPPSTPCPAAGPSGPSTPPPRHRNDGWHVGVADPPINSIPILGTHWVAGVKKWRETQTRPSNQNLGGPGLQDRGHRRREPARVDSVHARILEKKVGSGPARPDSPSREADRADRADTRRSHFTN